jgi:hypothetical protein
MSADPKIAKDHIVELVRRHNDEFARDAAAAREHLKRAVWAAKEVWDRDYDNPEFQRSVLAQIPTMIDPDAPLLKPPIDLFDILDARFGYPHPDFYDPVTDMTFDGDVHQGHHALQSAAIALQVGWSEEVVLAAFLHDYGKLIRRQQHSFFSAEMIRPYVSEKVHWLVLQHFDAIGILQPDEKRMKATKLVHPTQQMRDVWYNRQAFKPGARVPNRIGLDLAALVNHPWAEELAQVREADDWGRIPHYAPDVRQELKTIIERHFKLPKQGLGADGSSASAYWKLIIEGVWMT